MRPYDRSAARRWAAAREEEAALCGLLDMIDELEGSLDLVEDEFATDTPVPVATIAWWVKGSAICRVMRRTPLPRN